MNLKTKKLRKEAERRGLSIVALARLSGVSRTTTSLIMNGKSCSAETAEKIAAALGVPLEDLEERGRRP